MLLGLLRAQVRISSDSLRKSEWRLPACACRSMAARVFSVYQVHLPVSLAAATLRPEAVCTGKPRPTVPAGNVPAGGKDKSPAVKQPKAHPSADRPAASKPRAASKPAPGPKKPASKQHSTAGEPKKAVQASGPQKAAVQPVAAAADPGNAPADPENAPVADPVQSGAGGSVGQAEAAAAVVKLPRGQRLRVWWDDDNAWYTGQVNQEQGDKLLGTLVPLVHTLFHR